MEPIQQISDKTVVVTAVAASSVSTFAHWMNDFGSVILIWLNILLVSGGLILLFFRIVKAYKAYKDSNKSEK